MPSAPIMIVLPWFWLCLPFSILFRSTISVPPFGGSIKQLDVPLGPSMSQSTISVREARDWIWWP